MEPKTIILLIISSLFNGALAFLAFVFGVFATSPDTSDVTMRAGFYVVNLVAISGVAGFVVPWLLVLRAHTKSAIFFAILPLLLACLAVLAFLTLDSWLSRTFS